AINFYGGMQIALPQLEKEGLRMELEVLDSRANAGYVEKTLLANPDLKQKDLIFGPYRRDNISLVADFARKNNITFVSPYSASSGLSPLNPNYIQVNPSFNTHCYALTKHALDHFTPSNIILVARNEQESTRFPIFQDAMKTILMTTDSMEFKEFIVPSSYTDFDETMLAEFLEMEGPVAFIVPSWSDEIFVSNFLRVLDIARIVNEEKEVRVYGMPQWKEFSKVDYDYFEKLDLHISCASFVNDKSLEVKKFRKDFFNKFNTIPTEEAYLGYDVMLYFGRMLLKYGTKFQSHLETEPGRYLQGDFKIEPVLQAGSTAEEPGQIEQFENKAIFILRYNEYQFQPSGQ
ncbi:MAG: amino acid ABC transporter substrate-binding protein, partial [Saprospiraceae bacterium]|nr:amino acid ABC transporter substrate-binding protein [Saprospiraceae bacterium]